MATYEFKIEPIENLITKKQLEYLKFHLKKNFLPSRAFREGREVMLALSKLVRNNVTYKISHFVNKYEIDELSKVLNSNNIPHLITKKSETYWFTLKKEPVEKIPAKKFDANLLDLPGLSK